MQQQDQNKPSFQQGQQGSGSAENTGRSREDQGNRSVDLDETQRKSIADEAGLDAGDITDLRDLGVLSGRDDASGGSGDRMEDENTGKATDR